MCKQSIEIATDFHELKLMSDVGPKFILKTIFVKVELFTINRLLIYDVFVHSKSFQGGSGRRGRAC